MSTMTVERVDWDRLERALSALSAEVIQLPPSATAEAVDDLLEEVDAAVRAIEQNATT